MREPLSLKVAPLVGLVAVALAATLVLSSCGGERSATAQGGPSPDASAADERAVLERNHQQPRYVPAEYSYEDYEPKVHEG